jgi:hypothetical protein
VLGLRRVARQAYGETSALSRDPLLIGFMGDLIRPWGLAFRPEVLAAGQGHTYAEMTEQLIPALVPAGEPVDVLVLAYGVHDVRPGRSTATYLSSLCPGAPVAFAICDEGPLASFTALRLLADYTRTGAQRAVLVVVEQSALHYETIGAGPLPDRHAAVVLLFDTTGPGRVAAVRQYAGLSRVDGRLAADVAELAAGRGDVTLVPGDGLAGVPLPEGVRVRPGPAGQPYTAPWWTLADPHTGLVLLADTDAGELAIAALDFTPDPGGPTR